MWAFLQPISARIYFGKTASHRKRARFVQSRGASPQAYWMSVKAAQRWGCAKRAFYGVCFLMPGGLTGVLFYETVEKACHCEPVLTLARQSVSKTYKSCAFRRFLPEKITDSHVASRREASALGVLLGMTGAGFIDTLKKERPAGRSFLCMCVYLLRYSSMDLAPSLPAPMARMTVAAPVTASPPAYTA